MKADNGRGEQNSSGNQNNLKIEIKLPVCIPFYAHRSDNTMRGKGH